jgi:glycosyltransferase involved in cell wall biosynthesis
MRLLFVTAGYLPGDRGGTELHAHMLAQALVRLGNEVAVFCREADGTRPDYAERADRVDGIPVFRINYNFRDAGTFDFIHRNRRIEDVFVRVLRRVQPDLVHVHHLTCLSTGILDRVSERNIPLVMTLHDFWMVCPRGQRLRAELDICEELDRVRCAPCLSRLWPRYDISANGLLDLDRQVRRRLGRCDLLIAPSQFHRARMLEFGLEADRFAVVEHGLELEKLYGARRGRSRIEQIGYVGSVIPSKGVHILVEAFNQLGRKELRLQIHGETLNFHGDTGYGGRLRQLALPALDVRFHGPYDLDALPAILHDLDLLVVPSLWWESFCLTIREAFVGGIPVVASDIGAMAEAFRDGRGGVHFRAGDTGDLQRVLAELVDEPRRYRALIDTVPRVRSIDDCARETAEHYGRIHAAKIRIRVPTPECRAGSRRRGGSSPYATVFIPTWNGGAQFARVLDKVMRQETSFDYEVLVIDSGSADGTAELVRAYPSIRLIPIRSSEFNHGLTRNQAVQEARGEVVVLLTQDAEPLDEHWLQRLVSNLNDDRVAGAYCHQVPRADCNPFQRDRLEGWTQASGDPCVKGPVDPAEFERMHPFDRYRLIAFDNVASCVRKSVMERFPFERRQFGEDVAWAKQVVLAGYQLVNDPGAVVIHSHNRSMLYEFKRVYLDHQNLHDLVDLHTVPRLWMVASFSIRGLMHLWRVVWRDDRGFLYRLSWMLKVPFYSFTQNLAQYLGAKSAHWKHKGRFEGLDRWMRRAV